MRIWLLPLALLLPLAGMVVSILVQQTAMSQGSDWQIPVSGYDPRDPLRGQYVQFQYDWQLAGDASLCLSARGCDLCLEKDTGVVRATIIVPRSDCANRVDVDGSRLFVRSTRQPNGPALSFSGRLFVSEASAPRLEEQLRSGPMAVAARLTASGRLVPLAMVAQSQPASAGPVSPDARSEGQAPSAVAPPGRDPPPR